MTRIQTDPAQGGYEWRAEPDQKIEGAFVIRDASGSEVVLARDQGVVDELITAFVDAAELAAAVAQREQLRAALSDLLDCVGGDEWDGQGTVCACCGFPPTSHVETCCVSRARELLAGQTAAPVAGGGGE